MAREVDMSILDEDDRNAAVIEIQAGSDLSQKDVMETRQWLLRRDLLPDNVYLMVVSQDTGFLWNRTAPKDTNFPPDYEFPMQGVVSRYFPSLKSSDERLWDVVLETVIYQWMLDLSAELRDANDTPENIIAPSGFLEALKVGDILTKARV